MKRTATKSKKKPKAKRGRLKRPLRVRGDAPVYQTMRQHDLFETAARNGQRLGYSPTYTAPPFTNFRSVDSMTDLSMLNLNWREADLPEKERTKHVHRLHPYLGKFIPQLVEIFLRKFRPKTVYDPFAGSGTTLVEARALGVVGVGCDVSAFNCLLMKVKTDTYEIRKLKCEIRDALDRLNKGLTTSLFGEEAERLEANALAS